MYPADPCREAQHVRLMNELKDLYVKGVIQADLKKAVRQRLTDNLSFLYPASGWTDARPVNYFSPQRIAVYSVIFGPVDIIHEPLTVADNCDYFLFTDQPVPPDSTWVKKDFTASEHGLPEDNALKSRYIKMFPDQFFPEYDFTLYLDGKYQIRTDPTELIGDMGPLGLKMFQHPQRTCVYQEIRACLKQHKGSPEALKEYARYLRQNGMPRHYGLLEGAILLRETGNPRCQAIMNQWWDQFYQHIRRDQLSLPFILWQNEVTIEQVGLLGNQIWSNPIFRKYPHRRKPR
jgi:hypothetical protein